MQPLTAMETRNFQGMGGTSIPTIGKLCHLQCQLGTLTFNIDTVYVTTEKSYFLSLGQDIFNPDKVVRLC